MSDRREFLKQAALARVSRGDLTYPTHPTHLTYPTYPTYWTAVAGTVLLTTVTVTEDGYCFE